MKIILQKPVEKLGEPGDVADVADGYARNYLIPRGLAIRASRGAAKQAEVLKRAHQAKLGPIQLSVKEKEQVNVPQWAGLGSILVGVVLLVAGSRKK